MAKGRTRRKIGREVRMDSNVAAPQSLWKPTRKGMRHDPNYIDLATGLHRVFQGLWWDGTLLSDFVLVHQMNLRGKWRDLVKVDCCHQEVHAHCHRKDGSELRKVLQPVATAADLRIGLDKANEFIFDNWQNNLRRWSRGR